MDQKSTIAVDPLDMSGIDPNERLAEIFPSTARRYFGLFVLYAFGALLVYIAAVSPPSDLKWLVFLLLVAGGSIFLAEKFRRATQSSIYLTKEGLYCSDGRLMVSVADVKSIDRGVFAFKPSNGFMINTKSKQSRVWAPGLWWRVGARVGVGGVLQGGQTKSLAEILAALAAGHYATNEAQV